MINDSTNFISNVLLLWSLELQANAIDLFESLASTNPKCEVYLGPSRTSMIELFWENS